MKLIKNKIYIILFILILTVFIMTSLLYDNIECRYNLYSIDNVFGSRVSLYYGKVKGENFSDIYKKNNEIIKSYNENYDLNLYTDMEFFNSVKELKNNEQINNFGFVEVEERLFELGTFSLTKGNYFEFKEYTTDDTIPILIYDEEYNKYNQFKEYFKDTLKDNSEIKSYEIGDEFLINVGNNTEVKGKIIGKINIEKYMQFNPYLTNIEFFNSNNVFFIPRINHLKEEINYNKVYDNNKYYYFYMIASSRNIDITQEEAKELALKSYNLYGMTTYDPAFQYTDNIYITIYEYYLNVLYYILIVQIILLSILFILIIFKIIKYNNNVINKIKQILNLLLNLFVLTLMLAFIPMLFNEYSSDVIEETNKYQNISDNYNNIYNHSVISIYDDIDENKLKEIDGYLGKHIVEFDNLLTGKQIDDNIYLNINIFDNILTHYDNFNIIEGEMLKDNYDNLTVDSFFPTIIEENDYYHIGDKISEKIKVNDSYKLVTFEIVGIIENVNVSNDNFEYQTIDMFITNNIINFLDELQISNDEIEYVYCFDKKYILNDEYTKLEKELIKYIDHFSSDYNKGDIIYWLEGAMGTHTYNYLNKIKNIICLLFVSESIICSLYLLYKFIYRKKSVDVEDEF